jgi:23S rRNA U2552 (ribose-2'-O)-methylase RlmE/FtsJ
MYMRMYVNLQTIQSLHQSSTTKLISATATSLHDICNPLRAIIIIADLLTREGRCYVLNMVSTSFKFIHHTFKPHVTQQQQRETTYIQY